MTFNSSGQACQYLIDTAGLTVDQIKEYTERTGLTVTNIAGAAAKAEADGLNVRTHLETQIAAAEQKRKEYALEDIEKESAAGYLQEFLNGIGESVNTPRYATGFQQLDQVLDGGLYEGLYIVGAIASLGKTTFIMQIADQLAEQGHDVMIFSLEMSRFELMAKSISRITLLECLQSGNSTRNAKTARDITDGAHYKNYSQTEIDLIHSSAESYSEYATHIYIYEGVGDIGVDQIRTEIEHFRKAVGHSPVVIIDYVQILAPYEVKATDKANIDKAVVELKRMSRDFKVIVIGISSFNRGNYDSPVTFNAFKESGKIEYGGDVLIGLQLAGVGGKEFDSTTEKNRDPRRVEALILKNRGYRVGDKVCFNYYPAFNYFKEVDSWN